MASQKALSPPLQLYRQILRAHRKHLPPQFRILGDGYVKTEFHRHKEVDNPLYIVGFLEQWQDYLNHILAVAPSQQQQQSQNQASIGSSGSISISSLSTGAGPIHESREETLRQLVSQGQAFGKKLDPVLLDKMSEQQLGQLYELRKEAKGLQTPQELEELAKEETKLLEKVAATLPASVFASSASSS